MVYCEHDDIRIRDMESGDARIISDAETAQGWHPNMDKYLARLEDQSEGRSFALVAEYRGRVAGYVNVYPDSKQGAFAGRGLPEIVDLGVLERFRRRGIGSALMDVAEAIAARYADAVFLGVGLHEGYGSAQRLYVRRGYIPDGTGAWYGESVCPQYADCRNDDSLVLYLSKQLKQK